MPHAAFQTALQSITAGTLSLGELVGAAAGLSEAGERGLALQLYKIWIAFNREHPQLFVAHFNCSGLHTATGDLPGAIAELEAAIAVNPDFLPAYVNLGGVLEQTGELDRGVAQWTSVINRPTVINGTTIGYNIAALKQIGRVLGEHQKLASAEAALKQCLEIAPTLREVAEQFIAMRLGQCKWPAVAPWDNVTRHDLIAGMHPLSMAAYTDDPLLQLASGKRYVEVAGGSPPEDPEICRRDAPIDLAGRRLRVGYVSSDLRDHAVGYLMAELFEVHDRARVEVFAYYCGVPPKGALHERIKGSVEHWRDIRTLTDDAAARLIAEDGIDILIDVNGHTRDARLGVFARRPAPIQVNWLGYPGTMGSPYHHYIIGDPWIIPEGSEAWYSEQVVRLPCYQPNDRKRTVSPHRPSRRDAGLPDDAFVFCCFNGPQKFTRFTMLRWLEIIQRTPGSVLWLLECTEEAQARIVAFFEEHGVFRERIIFAPKQANADHLARYPLADMFLDTVPYGAHTTASDALWMGVPVLTLSGRSFASRVCGSLVRSAGAPELVCTSPTEFVERAVQLAADRPTLQAIRTKLIAGRGSCVLFDMDRLVSSLEGLYAGMVADYQAGRLPRPDLANMDAYLDVGVEHDHETVEMLAVPDYEGLVRSRLARRHRAWPMGPDTRLWTAEDIAAAEGRPVPAAPKTAIAEPAARRRRAG